MKFRATFLSVGAVLWAMPVLAGDLLLLADAPENFSNLIHEMRTAIDARDPAPIYQALSDEYTIERDFGGGFDPTKSPVENFSYSFPFDASTMSAGYEDWGWNMFSGYVLGDDFEQYAEDQICGPYGAMETDPFPSGQLCFDRDPTGNWRISKHVQGGD